MDDRRDLTPGDPLAGASGDGPGDAPERPPREHPSGSLFHDPARAAHYGDGPVPPGAFAGRRDRSAPPAQHELAEVWRRALALVLDAVIVGGVAVLVVVVIGTSAGWGLDEDPLAALGWAILLVLLYALLALVYAPILMARTNGQTLGKLLTGCRVVRTDGRRVGFWWAAYREVLVKGVVLGIAGSLTGGIAYLVNFLWPLWDRQNRALHDFVVDSRVVRA
jgi:uncharacterized RDD family membrane protein YckC